MTTDRRISVTLILSLILWVPSMQGSLSGSVSLEAAGLRYLAGLAVTWVSIDLINRMFVTYSITSEARALQREIEEMEARKYSRRAEDTGPQAARQTANTGPAEPQPADAA